MTAGVGDEPTLGEINRRLDVIVSRLDRVIDDHEARLRRLEAWAYALPPTFLLALAGVIAAFVKG